MRKNVVLNSPRLTQIRRKKNKSARKKMIILLIIFFIILVGLSFASRISSFNIKNVKISGNKIIETKDIQNIVKNEIDGHYMWLFPKTNFAIYPKSKIITELKNSLKRIKDVSINNSNVKDLEVSISEYEGKYLYCGTLVPIYRSDISKEANKCYFMDKDGYIFDEAPYFSGNVYFKFYGTTDKENPIGTYFNSKYFSKIISLKEDIRKMNLKPDSFFELGSENHEGEGFISLNGEPMVSPYLTFKLEGDYQKMTENLQAAISTEPFKTDLATKFSSLLYIDLKFGNKVFYKFQ